MATLQDEHQMWVNKYAPSNFEDTVGNAVAIDALHQYVYEPTALPSLILSGPPGCGKTTSVKCLATQILGERTILIFDFQ